MNIIDIENELSEGSLLRYQVNRYRQDSVRDKAIMRASCLSQKSEWPRPRLAALASSAHTFILYVTSDFVSLLIRK